MNPQGAGYGFDEEFADLIELNGYRVAKTSRSDDGGSEITATRTDEVGHKITYIIHYKKSDRPVDESEVEMAAKTQERHPGSISVVVSPNSGFVRSSVDLAERRGVRLWGPGEIERLRRNVAEKRSLRQREAIDRPAFPIMGKKSRSKAKFVALVIILSLAVLYVKFFGFETDHVKRLFVYLRSMIEGSGLRELDLAEIYKSHAPAVHEFVRNSYENIQRAFGGWQKA